MLASAPLQMTSLRYCSSTKWGLLNISSGLVREKPVVTAEYSACLSFCKAEINELG